MQDAFVDYVALIYHEARNARHLAKVGEIDTLAFQHLIDLPVNRDAAWREIQKHRRNAAESADVDAACAVFMKVFGLSLADLAELFRHAAWKHSAPGYAGNRWAGITTKVIDLHDAIVTGNMEVAAAVLARLQAMHHNNGLVQDKLRELDAHLSATGS